MGKISKKINDFEQNNSENEEIKKHTITSNADSDEVENKDSVEKNKITESVENSENTEKQESLKHQDIEYNDEQIKSIEDTANWLIHFFGKDVFINIKENPNFSIPYIEPDLELNKWLVQALKTVCSFDDIQNIGKNIHKKYITTAKNLKQAVEKFKLQSEQISKYKAKLNQLEDDVDNAIRKKREAEQKMLASVSIESAVEAVFGKSEDTWPIRDFCLESVQSPSEELGLFVSGLIKTWATIEKITDEPFEDELKHIDKMQEAIRKLLEEISGVHIPQRRVILDAIARLVSKPLTNFVFISPEETTQVDPSIHNAKGVGGSRVKEGISFAVLRKENRQTFQYADIEVY